MNLHSKTSIYLLFILCIPSLLFANEEVKGYFSMGYRTAINAKVPVNEGIAAVFGPSLNFSKNTNDILLSLNLFTSKSVFDFWYSYGREFYNSDLSYGRCASNSLGLTYGYLLSNNKHTNLRFSALLGFEAAFHTTLFSYYNNSSEAWDEELFFPDKQSNKNVFESYRLLPGFGLYKGEKYILGLETFYSYHLASRWQDPLYSSTKPKNNLVFQFKASILLE